MVVRLEYGKASFLFTSDVDKREEIQLTQSSSAISSTVVKIPRHGSATASSQEFIAAVKPKLAILSAGARSRAEAKRDEIVERYLAAGAEVLKTYEDGAIILETDGKTIRYNGFKSGKMGKLADCRTCKRNIVTTEGTKVSIKVIPIFVPSLQESLEGFQFADVVLEAVDDVVLGSPAENLLGFLDHHRLFGRARFDAGDDFHL